jgi:hypothetical protein
VTVVSEPHTHISDTVTAFVIGAVEQHVGLTDHRQPWK